ncbi:MAG: hypothetical protein FJ137_20240 [Deltaproteobacteria bacterium]|nr:hypothetical protein [Deltaproteobacteria bacterium]
MSGDRPPEIPRLPVAPLSLSGTALDARAPRELAVDDVDSATLAALVRLRHGLEQHHGWLLLGLIVLAMASVVGLGLSIESRLAIGAYAAAVALGAVGLGFVADRVGYGLFLRRARDAGLSERASAQLFRSAGNAGHWIDVLRACGHAPDDDEVAAFIRGR